MAEKKSVMAATFESLEIPGYRFFVISYFLSMAGYMTRSIAQGWLAYELTNSAWYLGVVGAAWGICFLLVSPLGGVMADRVDKRDLLVITLVGHGLVTAVTAVLIYTGTIQIWHLILSSVVVGTIWAFNMPARQAIVPGLVSMERMMNAIAINSGVMNVSRVLFPAIGGILVAIIGIAGVYTFSVVCTILSVIFMFQVSKTERGVTSDRKIAEHFSEGVGYVMKRPLIVSLITLALVPIFFAGPYQMLLPIFARDIFQVGAQGLGFLAAAAGIGATCGSFIVASLSGTEKRGMIMMASLVLLGIGLVLLGLTGNFYLSLILLFFVGMMNTIYLAINNTIIQMQIDDSVRGRVMSLYMMAFGLEGAGVLLAGKVAEVYSAPVAVIAGGILVIITMFVVFTVQPRLKDV